MYSVVFKDGVHITIDDQGNMIVNSLSLSDVEFNNIAGKAMNDETEYYRLINVVENRLGVEII